MTRLHVLALATLLAASCRAAPAPPPATPPARPVETAAAPDTLAAERQRHVAALMQRIAGKEEQPAEEVFRNIEVLKGVPAARLLRIMEMGYSRSLGVGCDHCHVVGEWAEDEKRPKEVARQMVRMVRTINTELLPNVRGLQSESPTVNCTTCHRGQVKPALNLPAPQRPGS